MIYRYHINHQGGEEQSGFAVATSGEQALRMAKERFPGWAVGSTVGVKAVVSNPTVEYEIEKPANLGWVSKLFQ
jgi:hypothetical protein